MNEGQVDPAMAMVRRALDSAASTSADPFEAAATVLARLERSVGRSIGTDGWRLLLQRGLVETRLCEPALQEVTFDVDGRLVWVSRPAVVEALATEAVASLLVTAIQLLGRLVGRDLALHLLELGLLENDDV